MNSTTSVNAAPRDLVAEVEALGERLAIVRERIGEVIFGQTDVIEQALITILSGGHALLIGVPGLAKTRLVETLGAILGLDDKRIQCTPDLMPADILGSEVLEESETGRRSFRFIPGPVFCQLLMADEINRASPRTQSALLQAMQEGRVSIAGQYHPLPRPFHVLATQNPLEQEGTYPLPEAQLDRFLLQIDVDYPDRDAERRMLIATTGLAEQIPRQAMTSDELLAAQRLVRRIPVGDSVVDAILTLVAAGRPERGAGRAPVCRLGTGAARQPGADARLPRPRAARRPLCAVDRRCRRARPAGVAPPHGGQLRRARRGRHGRAADRRNGGAAAVISVSEDRPRLPSPGSGSGWGPRRCAGERALPLRIRAEQTAAALPPLLVAAERVAATVAQGVHGRRRVGQGEAFWQFRQYQPGDAAARIDWRESAKSQRLYVRETEWEAAQSVWLWRDASASMDYSSAGYFPAATGRPSATGPS